MEEESMTTREQDLGIAIMLAFDSRGSNVHTTSACHTTT